MGRKSEVYTWRVSPALKMSLEEEARATRRPLAEILDEIVVEHLRKAVRKSGLDDERQRRLHERAARFAGRISGGDPTRAERARDLVRARLRRPRRER